MVREAVVKWMLNNGFSQNNPSIKDYEFIIWLTYNQEINSGCFDQFLQIYLFDGGHRRNCVAKILYSDPELFKKIKEAIDDFS